MILSDRDIRARMNAPRRHGPHPHGLVIVPAPEDRQIQPASVDVRLSGAFANASWLPDSAPQPKPRDTLVLRPGDFILAGTVEYVEIPSDLVAQVEGRSTYARKGIIVHATAGYIDPGFRGFITLEIANISGSIRELPIGARIAQLIFHQLSSRATRPYGHEELGSHYQDQRGPEAARKDAES